MRRRGSAARPVGTIPRVQESLVRAKELPLLREDRLPMSVYVPATDWRLRRHVLRQQSGRDKEVHVRASLTKRDASRVKTWQVGLLAVGMALVVGLGHPGASWGSSAFDPTSDPYSMQNITAGDGVQAWWNAGYTGKGVDVAVIDTGLAPVAGLNASGKVINGPDLSLESQNPSLQYLDTNGHGTFMAGVIAGNDGRAGAYPGAAPDARIVSLKVGVADGGVDVSQVIAAIDWVVQHRNDNGMNVREITLSYGTAGVQSYQVDPLAAAVEHAWKAGSVIVGSGGNTGTTHPTPDNPAIDPFVIAVGADDTKSTVASTDDVIPQFSARGSAARHVDIVAPGQSIVSLRNPGSVIDTEYPKAVVNTRFFKGSGTSQAAAVVSGAVALVLQQHPAWTPDQVKAALTSTAVRLPQASSQDRGAGLLNVVAASAAIPGTSAQPWTPSSGLGTLEGARGSDHVGDNGTDLTGEKDIFGRPWVASTWAAASASGTAWSGGVWNGSTWTGACWCSTSWANSTWSNSTWSGNDWANSTWSSHTWSAETWDSHTWSGSGWVSHTWSGHSWSGSAWG